jgi:carbamoyl-phosphate synthase large subunit
VLGPEMKSTGEVMGIDASFGMAYAKSQSGAYAGGLPLSGSVFVSAADKDKNQMSSAIKKLDELGFEIFATKGTAEFIAKQGIKSKILRKVQEGSIDGETTSTEAIMKGDIDLVVNTPHGGGTRTDGFEIRSAATKKSVPIITTAQGLKAAVAGIEALQKTGFTVKSLQEWAKDLEVARQKFYKEVGN